MRHLFSGLVFLFISGFHTTFAQSDLKDGDIIFIVNPSGQGQAIQLATGSEFTHVGIVFIEKGSPFVYHAVEPVSKNSLQEFVAMSADGKYQIRRLKNQDQLSSAKISAMRKEADSLLGVHYDHAFSWDDKELYCSEFVWKIYRHHLGIEIGKPKPMKNYNLSNPVVKEAIEKRYGKKIPLDEKMISPGDLYHSDLVN